MWATSEIKDVSDASELASRLIVPGYRAKVERVVVFTIEAYDWNCPAHITQRYTLKEIESEMLNGNSNFPVLGQASEQA